jgi:thiamine-monophosphate kinase
MDEFRIIAEIFTPLAVSPGAFGLKDDAALIAARPGFELVVTTDQVAEGTDFFKHDPAESVGRKALLVNLSDLAAKGAGPKYYLLNIAVPEGMTLEWLKAFAGGLKIVQDRYGLSLIGGDTSRTEGPLAIAITAFGFVPQGGMIRRSGARAGDAVYVTGTIGDSGGGLAIFQREKHALSEEQRDALIGRYRIPAPPVDFGAVALPKFAHASVDVSDGLIADLGHVADASAIRITLDSGAIPRSAALRAFWGDGIEAIVRAATAGDDYQIAFTADPAREQEVMAAAQEAAIAVTRIGSVEGGQGVILRHDGEVVPVPKAGYRHF